ncbi:hypothetical protein AB0N65_06750 [Paenarthrobacter sp. NPDC089322]|uniref:alpha-amylase family glycosyl hydrolase n=1 Tax=Paenarthrobacter sp. NPDC089322 TaxID=3155065 RepID=UPI00342FEB83
MPLWRQDGLRIDVANALFQAEGLPDAPSAFAVVDGLRSNPLVSDQDEVHEVYRRWRRIAEKYEPQRVLVGEVGLKPDRGGGRGQFLCRRGRFFCLQLPWSSGLVGARVCGVGASGLDSSAFSRGAIRVGCSAFWRVFFTT